MGEDRTGATVGDRRRLTVPQAADALGVTVDAVRGRIRRRKLDAERDEAGTVYVWVEAPKADSRGPSPTSHRLSADQSEHIEDLRSEIASLREQLRRADERDRENRRVIAALTSRIPAIEAPREPPEDAETVEEPPEVAAEPRSEAGAAQDELVAERARRETAETTLHEGMTEERRRREEAERERDDLRRELHARGRQQGAHETAEQQQEGRGQPQSATGGAQAGARRPWWRRMFRG